MDHFGARNQGGNRRKELTAGREEEGLGMRAKMVFKESRNSVGPRERHIRYLERIEKPREIQTILS